MLLSRERVGQGERLFHLSVDLAWLLPFGGRPHGWLPGRPADCPLCLLGRNYFIVENNRCSDRTEDRPMAGQIDRRSVELPCSDMDGRVP